MTMTDTPLFDLAVGFDKPRARISDPIASHEAADSISAEGLHDSQAAVLALIREHAPFCFMGPWRVERDLPEWSPSRVRTALVELERLQLIRRHKLTGLTPRGRRCDEFEAVTL